MRLNRIQSLVLGTSVAMVFCACHSEVEKPTWDLLDYNGLVYDIDHPTGELVDNSYEDTVEYIAEELGVEAEELGWLIDDLTVLYRQIETVLTILEESEGEDLPSDQLVEGQKSDGNNVFADLSCVGPDLDDPDKNYNHGVIRYESSSFSLKELEKSGLEAQLKGHVFVSFQDCMVGPVVFEGEAPGYLSDSFDQIALDLNVTAADDEGNERALVYRSLFAFDSIDVLVNVTGGKFYRLGLEPGVNTTFKLGTADGLAQCTIGVSGISCAIAQPLPS